MPAIWYPSGVSPDKEIHTRDPSVKGVQGYPHDQRLPPIRIVKATRAPRRPRRP